MYNDEDNLYHYTYRKDGSEDPADPMPQQPPIQEMKPVKEHPSHQKSQKPWTKLVALALACALLGGAVGGGVAWGLSKRPTKTSFDVSDRAPAQVTVHHVDGNKKSMSDAEVYASNIHSVVSINTTVNEGINFFGQPVQSASSGSGFVLTKDGYIVTNYHVVKKAESVKVNMYDGKTMDAQYIGGDEDYDIAVIKVEAEEDLPTVTLGDSALLNVGDRVLAVGNPLGDLTFSMSGGMVSSVNRAINVDGTPFNMIQTDTSINPGNSGGPLFNQYGEVVGIVSAKYSSYANQAVEGLGFAIPINDVFAMIKDIMTNGRITNKAYLGITPQTMTEQMAAQFQFDVDTGVFVCSVEKGSAADKAGLKMGDVITKVDDKEIKTLEDLNMAEKGLSAGDKSKLTVYSEGQEKTVEVVWGAKPEEPEEQEKQPQQQPPMDPNQTPGQAPGQAPNGYMNPWDMFQYFFG